MDRTDSYTLYGPCLKSRTYDQSGNGSYWVNGEYDWGYADNFGNDRLSEDDNAAAGAMKVYFKISNAVDKNGQPANLKYIDFIRVQTGVNAKAGWLGENSTEVFGFTDENINQANRREYENNRYNLLPRTTVHGMQRREDRTALGQRQLHSIVFADYRRRHLPGRHPRRPDYGKHPLQRIVRKTRRYPTNYASTPRSHPDPATVADWDQEWQFLVSSYDNQNDRTYLYTVERTDIATDGSLTLRTQAEVDAFARSGINTVEGNLTIGGEDEENPVTNLDGLKNLVSVRCDLTITAAYTGETLAGLENLTACESLRIGSAAIPTKRSGSFHSRP